MSQVNPQNEVQAMVELMQNLGHRDAIPDKVLRRETLLNKSVLTLSLGNPWYTGTPVSTVQSLDVRLAGVPVPRGQVHLVLRDQWIGAESAQTFHELWWGFAELATLVIETEDLEFLKTFEKGRIQIDLVMRSAMSYGLPDDRIPYSFEAEVEVKP